MKIENVTIKKAGFALAGTAILVGALAACGTSDSSTESASTATSTSQAATFANGTVPEAVNDMTALFGTVTNPNSAEIKLVGCNAEIAGKCEIHEVIKKDGKETMQQVTGGLAIPADGSVELKSGSYHVMLMNLKSKPAVGSSVPVTLQFSNGTVDVTGKVETRMSSSTTDSSTQHGSGGGSSGHSSGHGS